MPIDISKFKVAQSRRGGGNQKQDPNIYPFWNVARNETAVVRILPWIDPVFGDRFYAERKTINMKFTDSENDSKEVVFRAPCMEMYGPDLCPILKHTRELYKMEKSLRSENDLVQADKVKDVASAHWVKPKFYYQGFVQKDPIGGPAPENPIRIFVYTKEIHQKMENDRANVEMFGENFAPYGIFTEDDLAEYFGGRRDPEFLNYFNGNDFLITKTERGGYDAYNTSGFKAVSSRLTDEQFRALETYGFHNLRDKLPQQPTTEQVEVLSEMMQVSIARALGEDEGMWNPEWEKAGFKPWRPNDQGSKQAEDEEEAQASETVSSVRSRVSATRTGGGKPAAATTTASTDEGMTAESTLQTLGRKTQTAATETAKPATGGAQSMKDRIAALKNKQAGASA